MHNNNRAIPNKFLFNYDEKIIKTILRINTNIWL
jgi:hypothetical protein